MRYTKTFILEVKATLKKHGLYGSFSITPEFLRYFLFEIEKYHLLANKVMPLSQSRRKKAYRRRMNYIARALVVIQHERDGSAKNIKAGYVYAIVNPKSPGKYKIGESIDAIDRLNSYQTYDPDRCFSLFKYIFVFDRKSVESELHRILDCDYEWASSDDSTIKKVFNAQVVELVDTEVLGASATA